MIDNITAERYISYIIFDIRNVHASDKVLSSTNSAKLYVYDNGDTLVQHKGMVSDTDMKLIQEYIKLNHEQMYKKWKSYSENGYYKKQ